MRMRVWEAGLVFFLVVGSVTACGSGTDTEDAASGTSDDASEDEWESPIADYLGIDTAGFGPGDEGESEAKQIEVNESVTTCMAAEGFDWLPDPNESTFAFGADSEDGLEWGSEEWTAKYGLGISTQAFSQEQVGPDLIGHTYGQTDGPEAGYIDPNADYLEGLSDAEREEFYATLYGEDQGPDIDFEALTEEEVEAAFNEYYADYEPTGCMELAQQDIFGFGPGGDDYWSQFSEELQEMYEQMQEDPRITAADQKVSECMAGKGVEYTDMETVYESYNEKMEPLYEAVFNQDPGFAIDEEQMQEMSEEELNEMFRPQDLTDEQKTTLGEIQDEEIKLAVGLGECGGDEDALEGLYQEVSIEYEQRFIDQHREALDAYKAEREAESDDAGSSDAEESDQGS